MCDVCSVGPGDASAHEACQLSKRSTFLCGKAGEGDDYICKDQIRHWRLVVEGREGSCVQALTQCVHTEQRISTPQRLPELILCTTVSEMATYTPLLLQQGSHTESKDEGSTRMVSEETVSTTAAPHSSSLPESSSTVSSPSEA